MLVVHWKHQTSNLKFRGNFELAISTLERFQLPFVPNIRKSRTDGTAYHYTKSGWYLWRDCLSLRFCRCSLWVGTKTRHALDAGLFSEAFTLVCILL
jgi:hypothetical protein